MQIAEIYRSIQGEGLLAGTPSCFIRTSGCNLRCHWCDTPHTSWEPQGDRWSAAAVIQAVADLQCRHVVITGGEPLLSADLPEVAVQLRSTGHHVTIETAGSVPPAAPAGDLADLMSISPKLASSAPPATTAGNWRARHLADRRRDEVVVALLGGGYQLKFVIGSAADLDEALGWLDDLGMQLSIDPGRVLMMPLGVDPDSLAAVAAWLDPACRRLGFQFAPRHQVAWFGHRLGT
jgi:7-carboxy-7-deazaguanine synthase